jgi:hypothetical protein
MGYIGLLLNDPYKRDRIDGCMLDIVRFWFLAFFFLALVLASRTNGIFKIEDFKMGATKV